MTPVDQNKLYTEDAIGHGNCYTAALASLLDLPLWMVPPFEDMPSVKWEPRTAEWTERMFGLRFVRLDDHEVDKLPEFYIANGLSPRGVFHSVIYRRGELAHDPHPSRGGITDVDWTWHVEPIKPGRDG